MVTCAGRVSGVTVAAAEAALAALEGEGFVLRGRYTPELPAGAEEWCERRLLARIHRAPVELVLGLDKDLLPRLAIPDAKLFES